MKTFIAKLSIAVLISLVLTALIALFPNVSRSASRYAYPMVTSEQPGQEVFADRCDALLTTLDATARR